MKHAKQERPMTWEVWDDFLILQTKRRYAFEADLPSGITVRFPLTGQQKHLNRPVCGTGGQNEKLFQKIALILARYPGATGYAFKVSEPKAI